MYFDYLLFLSVSPVAVATFGKKEELDLKKVTLLNRFWRFESKIVKDFNNSLWCRGNGGNPRYFYLKGRPLRSPGFGFLR